MALCEDYPCCGHSPENPCEPQWYDKPDAFDTTKNPHALCDHENGECDVEDFSDPLDDMDDPFYDESYYARQERHSDLYRQSVREVFDI